MADVRYDDRKLHAQPFQRQTTGLGGKRIVFQLQPRRILVLPQRP